MRWMIHRIYHWRRNWCRWFRIGCGWIIWCNLGDVGFCWWRRRGIGGRISFFGEWNIGVSFRIIIFGDGVWVVYGVLWKN
jgi:hypothetical protein